MFQARPSPSRCVAEAYEVHRPSRTREGMVPRVKADVDRLGNGRI